MAAVQGGVARNVHGWVLTALLLEATTVISAMTPNATTTTTTAAASPTLVTTAPPVTTTMTDTAATKAATNTSSAKMAATTTTTQQVIYSSTATSQQPSQIPSPHCDLNSGASVAALAVDDPVMVCVFLSTVPPKKMIFKLVVEEYASLKLVGSQDLARGGVISNGKISVSNASTPTDDIHTWIARSDAQVGWPLDCNDDNDVQARGAYVSCPQIFASGSHVALALSLVVNLRDGLIHSFAWDNGCSACGSGRCMKSATSLNKMMVPGAETFSDGSCGQTYVKCQACDLEILVTWAGTDREGRHLQSAGRRLSRFSGSTIASLYETYR